MELLPSAPPLSEMSSAPPLELEFERAALDASTQSRTLKSFFQRGIEIDFYTSRMRMPLFYLKVFYGDLMDADSLLALGANIHARDDSGEKFSTILEEQVDLPEQCERLEWLQCKSGLQEQQVSTFDQLFRMQKLFGIAKKVNKLMLQRRIAI